MTATADPQNPPEALLDRVALFEQVKESTARNRNFFFIWIAFALYVIVTTVATTDLQLLLPKSMVTLPTIGVQLPLLGYFFVTPWLVLALHFNLLQNLDTHAHKLQQWVRCYPNEQPPRVLLQAFLFDFAMLEERKATFNTLTRWFARLLCYSLGPITIGILLWRFTSYQDGFFTFMHVAAFLTSTALVIRAHHQLPQFHSEVRLKGLPIWPGRRIVLPRFLSTPHRALGITGLLLVISVLLESVEWYQNQDVKQPDKQSYIPEPFTGRLAIPPNTSLVSLDGNQKLRMELDGEQSFKVWWEKHGVGTDLRGRSLQGAILVGADMRKARLDKAQLQAADLSNVDLQGADLSDAQLQGANLYNAQLQGANLSGAQLQGVDLSNAQMQGASLSSANLQGANMSYAQMQGADLSGAQLQGANLSAYLQGTNLYNAQMQGANLLSANLQGADLSNADLQGAIVTRSFVNTMPTYKGVPLVGNWVASTDAGDWDKWLKQMPDKIQIDIQKARDKAKQPPLPGLQEQLDTTRTREGDYPQVATDMASNLCASSAQAVRGTLDAWTQKAVDDQLPNLHQRGAILADALLKEKSCLSYRETVCQFVKKKSLPIKDQQACNKN